MNILCCRYLQLKEAWYDNQPDNFKDAFELNKYCSEAVIYVVKLEGMLASVKTMYDEIWYAEQYKKRSKHGFHGLLAGEHGIFILGAVVD